MPAGVYRHRRYQPPRRRWIPSKPTSSGSFTGTATDTLTFTDAVTRAPVSLVRSCTDSVTLSDSTARVAAHPRASTDTVTFSESLTRGATAFTRIATDTVTFSDDVTTNLTVTTGIPYLVMAPLIPA